MTTTNHQPQTTIKERPILFSGPEVRAILDGRKTALHCLYSKPGDRLWVRETHRYWWPEYSCCCRYRADNAIVDLSIEWDEGAQFLTPEDAGLNSEPAKWRSPISMPRWASRITLEITGVRVERLQDISGIEDYQVLEFKRIQP